MADIKALEARKLLPLVREPAPPNNLYATAGPNAFCPTIPWESEKIEWDMRLQMTGVASATHRDADIESHKIPGVYHFTFDGIVWRIKILLKESDRTQIRMPGTRDDIYGDRLIVDSMADQAMVLDNTKEWAVWQMLSGSLPVLYDSGQTTTFDYLLPEYLAPTAGTLWSDTANANPEDDIRTWLYEARTIAGYQPGRFVFSSKVERYLAANDKIRALIQNQFGLPLFEGGRLPNGILGIPHDVYDGQYMARELLGTAYTTGNDIVLEKAGQLADVVSGDIVKLGPSTHANNPGEIEIGTVSSIASATITLTGGLTNDFAVRDPVTWNRPFLHPDKFVILPANTGQRWCEWGSAQNHVYGRGRTGRYVNSEPLPGTPKLHEIMSGEDGGPLMKINSSHTYATVL